MAERAGENHYGTERHESSQEKAERLLAQELKRRHWTDQTLRSRRKGDPEKVEIAALIRGDTVMTLKWIAHRLQWAAGLTVPTVWRLTGKIQQ